MVGFSHLAIQAGITKQGLAMHSGGGANNHIFRAALRLAQIPPRASNNKHVACAVTAATGGNEFTLPFLLFFFFFGR